MDLEKINSFIFDFDSTLASIETLDSIIKNSAGDEAIRRQIDDITLRAMDGKLDFHASISTRLRIAKLSQRHFDDCIATITSHITPGIEKAIDLLRWHNQKIFILSAGFINIVRPVAARLRIPPENCFANDYILNEKNELIDLVESPLIYEHGKSMIIKNLKAQNTLVGKIIMIGDGMSDCRTYLEKDADYFIGCGFNVVRESVRQNSPIFANTMDEFLTILRGALGNIDL
jgi:HAD superfamily phosphoserine phosphatase-like hydrolase